MPFDSQENPHCNVAKMLAVADAIAADPESMDMSTFTPHPKAGTHCGTAQCIAGWAIMLDGGKRPFELSFSFAKDVLGLSSKSADHLFYGHGVKEGMYLHQITADHAIQAIQNVIETGDPQWDAVTEDFEFPWVVPIREVAPNGV